MSESIGGLSGQVTFLGRSTFTLTTFLMVGLPVSVSSMVTGIRPEFFAPRSTLIR
ncbi:MAG: hypothetical protein ACSLFI_10515 [Solirubrobacterales bacterium]